MESVDGFPVLEMDRIRLMNRVEAASGVVKYKLDAKPAMGAIPGADFTVSDCSGFVRWLIDGATAGMVTPPDGSWNQHDWCIQQKFKSDEYLQVAGLGDNRLRIAFINPAGGEPGHVWLILNGQTIECCGGRGVCRRPWNTAVLRLDVAACYVLTGVLT